MDHEYETIAEMEVGCMHWMTTNQVARVLQISPSTLEKARCTGEGPWAEIPYHKIGRSVRYAATEVRTFLSGCQMAGNRPKGGVHV